MTDALARLRAAVGGRMRTLSLKIGDGDLAKDTVWGLVFEGSMLLSVLVSFYLLGRNLGTDGYGLYAGLYAIIAPLGPLAASGMSLTVLQHAIRDHEPLETVAGSTISLTLMLGSLLTVIGTVIGVVIVEGLPAWVIFVVMASEFVAFPIVQIIANVVQAGIGFPEMVKVKLLPPVFKVISLLVLSITGTLTIGTFGLSYLAINVLLGLWLMPVISRRLHLPVRPGPVRWNHLRSSATYSTGITASSLTKDGDKIVLVGNGYDTDNGLYSAAFRIIGMGTIPVASFIHVTHQRFLESDGDAPGVHLRRAVRFCGVSLVYCAVFAAAIWVTAPIFPMIMGSSFEGSVEMLRLLSGVMAVQVLVMFPQNGILGLGFTFLRTVLLIMTAGLAMLCYILLIPSMSWRGAVWGSYISEGIMAVVSWGVLIYLQRRHDRRLEQRWVAEGFEPDPAVGATRG
ncbi:MAG: lipopolysaccharide biosynthesis protein [Acidimicrobiales bacterium]